MKQSRNFAYITFADLISRSAYQMGKTPLLPIFAATLGASGAWLGFIVSVSTLTGMLLKPLIGVLSDRWGRRVWLMTGTIFFAAVPLFYRFVHTPDDLVAIRLVHGLATAIYGPVTLAYVAEQTRQRRAEKLGWFGMARSAGYIVGPAAAGWLLLVMDPVGVFTIIGLLSSLAFIPLLLLSESAPVSATSPLPLRRQLVQALRSGGRTPAVWLSGGLEAIMFVALYAVKAFLPLYGLSIGLNVALVGAFFAVQEAIHMLLKPFGGRLGDRLGYVRSICLGMFVLGITLPVLVLSGGAPGLLMLAALMGAAQALFFPATVALVSTQINRRHMGAGMGAIGMLKNAGKVAGPILGGLFIHQFDYAGTFQLLGLMLVSGAILLWAWSRLAGRVDFKQLWASP